MARVGAPGRHMVQNALAVLGAAHLVGADVARAALALCDISAEAGRGRQHVLRIGDEGTITLIDESYNANPVSVRAALELLKETPVAEGGRRVAVLGDMLELGGHAEKLHAGLATPVVESGADPVLLAGPHMASLAKALPADMKVMLEPTAEALKPVLLKTLRPGDVVMVKSSKGIGFSRLVEALLQKFPAIAGKDET